MVFSQLLHITVVSVLIFNFSLNISTIEALILTAEGEGWINCSLTREVDDAHIGFTAIGEVSLKGIDGSYWIGETLFNSSGGIINISSFNKETLSYTLMYEGEVNKNNCPYKVIPNTIDSKFIAIISGSCDSPSAIFDSRVINGKFNVTINCFE